MNVREFYEDAITRRGFTADEAQRRAVERLQRLDDDFVAFKKRRANAFLKVLDASLVHRRRRAACTSGAASGAARAS